MTMEPIFQIGKSSLTPENTQAISEALAARELIKISVLNNCMDDPRELAQMVAERTHAQVVQAVSYTHLDVYKRQPFLYVFSRSV